MLEQNDKQKDGVEDGAANSGESASSEKQPDAATALSQEFSSEPSQSKSIGFSSFAQLIEQTQKPESKEVAQENESYNARKSLSSEMLTSFQESSGAREEKSGRKLDASSSPVETPSLSITDIVSDLPVDAPGDDSSSDGSIKTSYFKSKLSKDLLRGGKHRSDHVANIHAEQSPAKSFHNQIDALPSTGTHDVEAVSKPTQTHTLTIDKPESFKDLERTTGGARPQSNILGTPPNVEAFPPNPPAITIHKPNIEIEKPGRVSGTNGEAPVAGGVARPGDGTEASPKDKLPTINFPIGDKIPLEKIPAGNNIDIPIDKFPKPGNLVLSPIDVRGPKNKDTIDLPVTGIPHIGDKFPSPANVHLGISVGKEPEHKLHSDPALSTLPVQPTFGLPIYTSINDAKSPAANTAGNAQSRELPVTTFSRPEPVNTVAQVSRYSSQEWMSSITSQTRIEEKAKTVTAQERQHTETQWKELQNEQQKELQKAPVERSQTQAQIDSFRAKNEQSIPSEALRNPTLIAYNAIPQGAAEKVFGAKSLVPSGDSQLMRNSSAAKNAELAMPQPFKLSNMDRVLFVPSNHKATSLEATVKGVQHESTAIAKIGKIEFAAKRALAAAEQSVATQQKTLEKVSAVKALDAGKTIGESKVESKVDLSQGKSAQKMSGLAQRNEISVSAERVQQNRRAILSEQARVEGTRRSELLVRTDLQLRFDPTAKVDTTKQRVVDPAQSKIETALSTNHKFVQIKPEPISITSKADSNSALVANNKLDRGFANKTVFAGIVSADSMVVMQNARKTAAGAGEIGCTKKGENNRFFPGAELTLAALLSLSGARKRRREERSQLTTSANNEVLAKQVLHRRTYLVEAGDTLQSISERFYDTREAAGLIVDLNALSINQQSMDGRTIIELTVRQILELPEAEEVSNYLATLSKNYNVEKIVTIVKENNVDLELLREFLGKVCDDKAAPQSESLFYKQAGCPRSHSESALVVANSVLPAKPQLPELVIEDDKTLPPSTGLGAVVTDLAMLISNGLKRPARESGALS
jgi:hypothetical protein